MEKETRRKALEDMIKISEEAGLYENEPTVDEHLDAVDRARKLIHMREAKSSTNLDGQTINIGGTVKITGYPEAFVHTLSDEVDRLNNAIAQAKDVIRLQQEHIERLLKTVERVNKLHELVTIDNAACGDPDCCGEYEEWEVCADCQCDYPCPTIQILNGDTDEL